MPSHPIQPPSWIDEAPIRFERSVEIAVSVEVVWGHIADHESWPQWFSALDQVEVTGSPTGVGGKRRVTVRRLPIDEEFTAWTDNEQFAFAVVQSKLPFLHTMAEDVQLAAIDDGCRVTYSQGIQAKRGFGALANVVFGQMPKQLQAALDSLKTTCEG